MLNYLQHVPLVAQRRSRYSICCNNDYIGKNSISLHKYVRKFNANRNCLGTKFLSSISFFYLSYGCPLDINNFYGHFTCYKYISNTTSKITRFICPSICYVLFWALFYCICILHFFFYSHYLTTLNIYFNYLIFKNRKFFGLFLLKNKVKSK